MTVYFAGQSFECAHAVKNNTSATLALADGGVMEFQGVNNWEAFTIEGGDWEAAPPSQSDRIAALEAGLLALMMGG